MDNDKITISMDEVNHATPVSGTTPPPIFTSGYVPPESYQEETPRRIGLYVGIGIAVVALLCISGVGIMALVGAGSDGGNGIILSGGRTVSDYKAEVVKDINEELSKTDSKLRKRIEDAHLTVKVRSTEIVRCDITTVDGSEKVGRNDSNIDKVSMLIRFNWEGIIDKGYTDLCIEYDVHNKRLLKSEIDHTTALVNIENPSFWYDVGYLIGTALVL